MSARFYVQKARADGNALRQRISKLGYNSTPDQPFDADTVATAYLGCDIVTLPGLTDRAALAYLNKAYGIDIRGDDPDNAPLAGGLYMTADGLYRWIFLEENDIPTRQRFTIAHELGHLCLEAEPALSKSFEGPLSIFEGKPDAVVFRYGRCPPVALSASKVTNEPEIAEDHPGAESRGVQQTTQGGRSRQQSPLDQQQIREITANHFAAELLLPYDGIRSFLAREVGPLGIRTAAELIRLANVLAGMYRVSAESARLRLTKDLGIVPLSESPNRDLFA